MTLLYLVRHGETELNSQGVYYGWTDCGLSDRGISQAREVAQLLKPENFDVVISSSLKRAHETARILSRVDEERIIIDERLRELNFGDWEGKHYREIQENDRANWDLWVNDWKKAAPPGGESFVSMYRRVKKSVNDILHQYQDKKVLLVSHQGCLKIVMCVLLGLKYEGYWHFTFDQGAYSLLEVNQGFGIVKKINQRT